MPMDGPDIDQAEASIVDDRAPDRGVLVRKGRYHSYLSQEHDPHKDRKTPVDPMGEPHITDSD